MYTKYGFMVNVNSANDGTTQRTDIQVQYTVSGYGTQRDACNPYWNKTFTTLSTDEMSTSASSAKSSSEDAPPMTPTDNPHPAFFPKFISVDVSPTIIVF